MLGLKIYYDPDYSGDDVMVSTADVTYEALTPKLIFEKMPIFAGEEFDLFGFSRFGLSIFWKPPICQECVFLGRFILLFCIRL